MCSSDLAISGFTEALKVKPEDAAAKEKKTAAENAMRIANEAEQNLKQLLQQAQSAFDKMEWTSALNAYKKIQEINKTHPEPLIKIPLCEEKILEQKLEEEARQLLDADYIQTMNTAKNFYDKKQWEDALKKFKIGRAHV